MPELPEVETLRRQLEALLVGRVPTAMITFWPRTTEHLEPSIVNARLLHQPIRGVTRRGKYLGLQFDAGWLLFHLKMTGRMYVWEDARGRDPWTRFSLGFSDGSYLIFSDARKFGRIRFVAGLEELNLGPEPLDMTLQTYRRVFAASGSRIKAILLDQSKIAGIGNIYADESLFAARIHPLTPGNRLSPVRADRLARAIRQTLLQAIDFEGATISWYRKPDGSAGQSQEHFQVYGRRHAPCPRCARPISKILVNQRSTHYCRQCQRY